MNATKLIIGKSYYFDGTHQDIGKYQGYDEEVEVHLFSRVRGNYYYAAYNDSGLIPFHKTSVNNFEELEE